MGRRSLFFFPLLSWRREIKGALVTSFCPLFGGGRERTTHNLPLYQQPVLIFFFFFLLEERKKTYETRTILNNGYLGSPNDEERSEMRYVMRIAEFSESSNL